MVISSECSEHRTSTERCFTEMKTGLLILTGSNRIVRKTKDFLDLGLSLIHISIDIKELVRQPYYENSSLYLKLNSTAAENATLELMKDSPFTEELKAQIENISGVTEIYPVSYTHLNDSKNGWC